jgi:dihydrofolate synthase/folylpolyglutamate synthase
LQHQIPANEDVIRRGLETVHWPGRLQLVMRPNGQRVLLDGAHNIAGAKALRTALTKMTVSDPAHVGGVNRRAETALGAPRTLILGILADKDCRTMCEILAPLATKIRLVPVNSERAAAPHELSRFCHAAHPAAEVTVCDSLSLALKASEHDPHVVVAGSLYLIGEAMELLGLSPVPAADEKALNNWQPVRDRRG